MREERREKWRNEPIERNVNKTHSQRERGQKEKNSERAREREECYIEVLFRIGDFDFASDCRLLLEISVSVLPRHHDSFVFLRTHSFPQSLQTHTQTQLKLVILSHSKFFPFSLTHTQLPTNIRRIEFDGSIQCDVSTHSQNDVSLRYDIKREKNYPKNGKKSPHEGGETLL